MAEKEIMKKYILSLIVHVTILTTVMVARSHATMMDGSMRMNHNMSGTMKKNNSGGMDMGCMDKGNMQMGGMHMMKMYFHKGHMVTLFFKDWITETTTEYNGACVALFLLAFVFEGIKVLRQWLADKEKDSARTSQDSSFTRRMKLHLLQTLLHIIQIFFGYLLMLAFMTYNTGICVTIIFGFGCGYLMFGWFVPSNGIKAADGECCNA